ncbi:helix-turn-helix domain-containing protein [Hydrogenophaga sp. BPS33]|uniref:helix-turn-helix domain-containing protein n=1 Tax=Hydrogenophaga sp. BPS33 TaxID=2651974 RepID=UPI00131F71E7|nr:helix-turn-helix domain-containing protein [Hydrogenophaga sp. BPS33]QHE86317.1 helix-turn-helix domain-containing protein [Hydrogenophaga sp. BPS33]
MSVRTMARVWEFSQHGGTHLLMLLAIADFADDQGHAYPSVTTLAEKCRMQQRNAQAILSTLRNSGELEVRPNEGPRGTNLYRIVLVSGGVQGSAPLQRTAPLQPTAPTPAVLCMEGMQPTAPEPSLNHQEPPVRAKRARRSIDGQTFDAWYAEVKASGSKMFADEDPMYAYLSSIGISKELGEVAWLWFKADQNGKAKAQKDWRQTFLNYLRKGWIRVWYRGDDGVWKLNTAGKQIAIEHDLDENMQSGGNGRNHFFADAI